MSNIKTSSIKQSGIGTWLIGQALGNKLTNLIVNKTDYGARHYGRSFLEGLTGKAHQDSISSIAQGATEAVLPDHGLIANQFHSVGKGLKEKYVDTGVTDTSNILQNLGDYIKDEDVQRNFGPQVNQNEHSLKNNFLDRTLHLLKENKLAESNKSIKTTNRIRQGTKALGTVGVAIVDPVTASVNIGKNIAGNEAIKNKVPGVKHIDNFVNLKINGEKLQKIHDTAGVRKDTKIVDSLLENLWDPYTASLKKRNIELGKNQ